MLLGVAGAIGWDGSIVSKMVLFGTVVTSGVSMYLLSTHVIGSVTHGPTDIRKLFAAFLSGYFYSLSPFLYNDLIGGAVTQFTTYAVFPLCLFFYLRALAAERFNRDVIWTSFCLSVIAISYQSLIIAGSVMILYAAVRGHSIKRLLQILLVSFWLNAYWISSTIESYGVIVQRYATSNSFSTSALLNLTIHAPKFLQGFYGTGYWFSFFLASIPSSFMPAWIIATSLLVGASVAISLLKPRRQLAFWPILFLISVALATGMNGPLSWLVPALFANPNPIALLFSFNPQRLVSPSVLALAVTLGVSSFSILESLRKRIQSRFVIGVLAVLLLIMTTIWVGPFYNGNLGGAVDTFQAPSWYNEMSELTNGSSQGARVLYLPMSHSPSYLQTSYQATGHQGGDPLVDNSVLSTIVTDGAEQRGPQQFAISLENLLYGDFQGFYPTNNSAIVLATLNFTSVRITVVNSLPHPALLGVNIYDLNRFLPGTVYGFLTDKVLNGLPVPANSSSVIIINQTQARGIQAGDVLVGALISSDGSVLEMSNKLIAGYILPRSFSLSKLLSFFDVKYVTLRGDVVPNFGPFSPNGPNIPGLPSYNWNYSRAYGILQDTSGLLLLKDWEIASLWENLSYKPSLVYAATRIETCNVVGEGADAGYFNTLSQCVLPNSFAVGESAFVSSGPGEGTGSPYDLNPSETVVEVHADRVDPTELVVHIQASGPFYLVFSESFDPRWHAFLGDPGRLGALVNLAVELPHFMVNGFGNGWLVSKGGTLRVTAYYSTQSAVYVGSIVSIATLLACLGFVLLDPLDPRLRNLRRLLKGISSVMMRRVGFTVEYGS